MTFQMKFYNCLREYSLPTESERLESNSPTSLYVFIVMIEPFMVIEVLNLSSSMLPAVLRHTNVSIVAMDMLEVNNFFDRLSADASVSTMLTLRASNFSLAISLQSRSDVAFSATLCTTYRMPLWKLCSDGRKMSFSNVSKIASNTFPTKSFRCGFTSFGDHVLDFCMTLFLMILMSYMRLVPAFSWHFDVQEWALRVQPALHVDTGPFSCPSVITL